MNNKRKLEEEISFKDLLQNPIRLFGWVFPYFFVILLIAGIFFVKNLSNISFNEQPAGLVDSTLLKKEIPLKKGGIMPAVDLNIVKTPTTEFTAKGKELYDANCKSCHGDNGLGDGTAGAALNPKPRNLQAVDGWTNGRTIDMLYKTLQEGIIKNGMAAYEYLSPADRFSIISYIRTFAEYPEIKSEELTGLDATYNLSAGTVVANTIPLTKAEEIMFSESNSRMQLTEKIKLKILNESDPNIKLLLNSTINNVDKSASAFAAAGSTLTLDNFASSLVNNPASFGFNASVLRLSVSEIKQIYEFMKTESM